MTEKYTLPGNPFAEAVEKERTAREMTGNSLPAELEAALMVSWEIRNAVESMSGVMIAAASELSEPQDDGTGFSVPETLIDPASDNFEDHVEFLAERLWTTDVTNRSAARYFSDDYEAIQDRYREQARALLTPGEVGR